MRDQTVLVLGVASGIGKATAERFGRLGARVACADLDEDGASAVADSLASRGLAARVDVRNEADLSSVVKQTVDRWGRLDALINCVGITGHTGLKTEGVSVDDFDEVYRVNLRGAFLATKVAIPQMLRQAYGRIVHVASIAGKDGNPGMVAYSATKAGVIGMVKAQGKEYAKTGITINAIAPAVVRTPLLESMPADQIEYMMNLIPMGRSATLDEVAAMITWIASSECSFTTGFTFDLSGGRAVY